MASLGDFFGQGTIGEQLLVWGLLNQVIGAATAPGITEITTLVNEAAPLAPLSPAQVADLVARALQSEGEASSEAAKSGISDSRFRQMVQGSQHGPDYGALVALLQRGAIGRGAVDGTDVSFDGALAYSGIRADWIDHLATLAVQIPSVQEVMNAWLEGQIEEAEASARYAAAGGDPTWFQTSYNAQGQAPTPVQALELLNRGIIAESGTGPDATSYEQAFLEGPWRNKWLPAFRALGKYLPPPRTVTAMLKEGAIDQALALQLLQWQGLTPELAAAYINGATHTATPAAKEISQSNLISLYEDKLLTRAEAIDHLVALKYTVADATLMIELADAKAAASATNQAVTRIRTLFLNGKDTAATATAALNTLGVTGDQATELVAVWELETAAAVKGLTAAEYAAAAFYQLITQSEALAGIQAEGYDAKDAWILLSNRLHSPAINPPPGYPPLDSNT